jgi:hypothetical protein
MPLSSMHNAHRFRARACRGLAACGGYDDNFFKLKHCIAKSSGPARRAKRAANSLYLEAFAPGVP